MKNLFLLIILCITSNAIGQIYDPVTWVTSVKQVSDTEYDLYMKAEIEADWHLYSQQVPEGGPRATSFSIPEGSGFSLVGMPSEEEGYEVEDPFFGMWIKYFENEALFIQRIKIEKEGSLNIEAEVEFMVCNETQCLPPTTKDLSFSIDIPKMAADQKKNTLASAAKSTSLETSPEVSAATAPSMEDEAEVAKELTALDARGEATAAAGKVTLKNEELSVSEPVRPDEDKASAVVSELEDPLQKEGGKEQNLMWSLFLATLIGGVLVTFTPCVFPMIPLTVSFFLKKQTQAAKGKFNALFYGLCIVLIHVVISLPFHVFETLNPNIFNAISTNVYVNLFFFFIFVVFAVSFFGAFEITIPNRFASKSDEASRAGGLLGIFFMALTLIIVSFSCTGPALGLVLGSVLSSDGGAMMLTVAMLGFGLGLAMPFMLFALFPKLLGTLPKSGGWLNTVKVVFGFIELALAFKFLSNADLVLQLHWLEREMFVAIWIAIFGGLTLYLFGKIKMPHDSPMANLSVGRVLLGLMSMSFTLYLIPGLWGAPLNLISAFPPPQHYSESPFGVGNTSGTAMMMEESALPDGAHIMAPHNILAFNDYDKGMAYAKKVGKPVLLDFTGHACVNCRKMEQNVWAKEEVLPLLKNEVVLISLYVDDKRPIPGDKPVPSQLRPGKMLKDIGDKWSEFQTIRYQANVQPFYVLLNHEEENLVEPVAYTPDVTTYAAWLHEGIAKF